MNHNEPQSHDLTDEQLEALLDEALMPAEAPRGLAGRIAAATAVARRRPIAFWRRDGVTALATAAVLALTVLGAWALLGQRTQRNTAPTASLAKLERELGAVNAAAMADATVVDQRIELLELQLEMKRTEPVWPSEDDPLSQAATEVQMQGAMDDTTWLF